MNDELPSIDAIESAISRGSAFLRSRQLASGELPVLTATDAAMSGEATPDLCVFPTAVAAYCLSFVPEAADVYAKTLDFLLRECDDRGLWRHRSLANPYHAYLPPDLDDTANASAALSRAGRSFPPNRKRLLRNRDRRGLFYTWRVGLRELRKARTLYAIFTRSSPQLRDVDAVVNAAVLLYLGPSLETAPVISYLALILGRAEEAHSDKWYDRLAAIYYFFSRALATVPHARAELRMIASRVRNLFKDGSIDGEPLDTALGAAALLNCGEEVDANAIAFLISTQMTSGGWRRAALYHGGERRTHGAVVRDPMKLRWGSEELTTAFCLEALARYAAASGRAKS
jgi:hypothetical protein